MSYILDALRKSDQLRQRGAAPTLLLGQATTAAPKQPARLYYSVLALVLLGAGIAIGWLHPSQPEPATPVPIAITAKQPAPDQSQLPAVRPALAPKPEAKLQVQNSALATQALLAPTPTLAPAPAAARAPALAQPSGAATVKIERQSAPPKAVAEVSTKAAAPVPEQAVSSSSNAAAPTATVMAMAELPVAIQQELPPMSVSVHAYSGKVAERLVGINSRLLHEGEYVVPGLRVEQITPDGMILSYKGYSFRRGVH